MKHASLKIQSFCRNYLILDAFILLRIEKRIETKKIY